jgi:hypothetical protein
VHPPSGECVEQLEVPTTCAVYHSARSLRVLSHDPICTLQIGIRPVAFRVVFALQGEFVRRLHRAVAPLGVANRAW